MAGLRTVLTVLLPVVVAHLLLPLSLLVQMAQTAKRGLPEWLLSLVLATAYFAFIYLAGAWSWFGHLARGALPLLLAVTAWMTFPHGRAATAAASSGVIESVLRLGLGAVFGVLAVSALLGRRTREPALDLAFPLRGGTFHVGQGGAARAVNHHFVHPSQRYALDILMLNRAGVRARGLYPARTDRYAIWGAEVVSPCDGFVAAAVDGLPDRTPPDRDPGRPAGNHVALECEGATIYLAHLMQGSVCVRQGDRVLAGQRLGRVGNSGTTTEPHLHIHAERGAYPGRFSGMPGIPVRLGGRFLVRNDRVWRAALLQMAGAFHPVSPSIPG